MITNFPPKNLVNNGGYKSFKFLPIESLDTYPVIINGSCQTAITTKNSAVWLTGYRTPETLGFTEELNTTLNGNTYLQKIVGFVPGNKPELINLMQMMDDRRFIVLIEDFYGVNRLVGDPNNPLRFRSDFSGETNRNGKKGFSYSFQSESLFRAPAYEF